LRGLLEDDEAIDETDRGVILIHRILARIQQKAKQLAGYAAPVILCISIPRADLRGDVTSRSEAIWLDLKSLAGAVTLLLTKLSAVSAVLITCWDVVPMPAKGGTRLANVELVERSSHQRGHPRVRILIKNPAAGAALSDRQWEALCQLL
jgi:hypothetical protein